MFFKSAISAKSFEKHKIMKLKLLSKLAKNQKGLTLIEIIIVLVILAVIMSWLGGKIFSLGGTAKADVTRLKLQGLKQDIYLYQMRNNLLPQDLKSMGGADTDLSDAWGSPIQFNTTDGGRGYQLKSLGADGKEGGTGSDEDIVVKGP